MIGTYSEISDTIAIVGFTFMFTLIHTLLNRNFYVPRKTSGLTALGILTIGFCFFDISLFIAGISEMLTGVVWILIFIWRGR